MFQYIFLGLATLLLVQGTASAQGIILNVGGGNFGNRPISQRPNFQRPIVQRPIGNLLPQVSVTIPIGRQNNGLPIGAVSVGPNFGNRFNNRPGFSIVPNIIIPIGR